MRSDEDVLRIGGCERTWLLGFVSAVGCESILHANPHPVV